MRVLMTADGSDFSLQAIKKGCEFISNEKEISIKVVSIYENPNFIATEPFTVSANYINEMITFAKEEAQKFVSEAILFIKENLKNEKIDLTSKVEMGNPAQEIIETAREWNADLIVVGSHCRGFWGRALIGSVSDGVVHHASCPVLIVRKTEGENVKSAGSN